MKEDYILARCCAPGPADRIVGYYSHDNCLKVHRHDCANLRKAEPARLVRLVWSEIVAAEEFEPGDDYAELEADDFHILAHHDQLGIDYSLKVARDLHLPKQEVFDRHRKLRDMGLLERVEPRMVRYRKGVVNHKWIKHRNHTYYDLAAKGAAYLAYHRKQGAEHPRTK